MRVSNSPKGTKLGNFPTCTLWMSTLGSSPGNVQGPADVDQRLKLALAPESVLDYEEDNNGCKGQRSDN